MWRSYKDYKHHGLLRELHQAMHADYLDWIKTHDIRNSTVNVFKYEYPDAKHKYADSWWAIPIAQGGKVEPNDWKRTSPLVAKLPGLLQCVINFIEPQGGLPMHKDMGSWQRIEQAIGHKVTGWTIGIGIDMPSESYRELAIKFLDDDIGTCYKNGEFVCFDGRNHLHEVWNKTDKWRVSAVIDLDDREFRNVVG